MFFVFDSIPNQFITQEICNIIVFYILFNSKTDRYKTQKMCDEAVDDCLAALEFIHDWLATSKIIKNFMLLCTQMMVYSLLMKILVMSNLLVIKWHS